MKDLLVELWNWLILKPCIWAFVLFRCAGDSSDTSLVLPMRTEDIELRINISWHKMSCIDCFKVLFFLLILVFFSFLICFCSSSLLFAGKEFAYITITFFVYALLYDLVCCIWCWCIFRYTCIVFYILNWVEWWFPVNCHTHFFISLANRYCLQSWWSFRFSRSFIWITISLRNFHLNLASCEVWKCYERTTIYSYLYLVSSKHLIICSEASTFCRFMCNLSLFCFSCSFITLDMFFSVELRQCVMLVELSLEHNKLIRPLLDFRSSYQQHALQSSFT